MEIYIVRHGETLWNKSKRLQGSRNIDLSEVGRNEARERGKQLENVDFDVIYSSPLNRAYETACIIRGERNIPIIKDDRLREINFGINEGMEPHQLKKDKNNSFCKFFDDPGNYVPPENGESFQEVCNRTKEFMKQVIEPQRNKLNRVMIAGHGAMNKGIMCYVLKHGIDEYWSGGLQKNCGVIMLNLDDNGYKQIGEM